jgi:hypothetical protein
MPSLSDKQGPYIYQDPRRTPPFSLAWLVAECNMLCGDKNRLLKVNTSCGLAWQIFIY